MQDVRIWKEDEERTDHVTVGQCLCGNSGILLYVERESFGHKKGVRESLCEAPLVVCHPLGNSQDS